MDQFRAVRVLVVAWTSSHTRPGGLLSLLGLHNCRNCSHSLEHQLGRQIIIPGIYYTVKPSLKLYSTYWEVFRLIDFRKALWIFLIFRFEQIFAMDVLDRLSLTFDAIWPSQSKPRALSTIIQLFSWKPCILILLQICLYIRHQINKIVSTHDILRLYSNALQLILSYWMKSARSATIVLPV